MVVVKTAWTSGHQSAGFAATAVTAPTPGVTQSTFWTGTAKTAGLATTSPTPGVKPWTGIARSTARVLGGVAMAHEDKGLSTYPRPQTPAAPPFKLLFVEMGTGYDQHGQDITKAAIRACKNAISSNSIPAFRTGALPGVSYEQMKLKVKLGVPAPTQSSLDIDAVKSVFPYGEITEVEVVDGGLICSSGVALEAMGDSNDDCYVVNAAIYIGY